jgi:hypothetical protein
MDGGRVDLYKGVTETLACKDGDNKHEDDYQDRWSMDHKSNPVSPENREWWTTQLRYLV